MFVAKPSADFCEHDGQVAIHTASPANRTVMGTVTHKLLLAGHTLLPFGGVGWSRTATRKTREGQS